MRILLIAICLLSVVAWSADDDAFKPRLVEPVTLPASVRPGVSFPLVLRFVNDGTVAAAANYRVFIHFEPEKECRDIAIGADHEPSLPTTLWKPGAEVVDGPLVINVKEDAKPGTYHFHVGVFGPRRFSDVYAGQLRVAEDAPTTPVAPALTEDEIARRRAAWAGRKVDGEVVDGAQVRLCVDRASGAFTITDKAAQVDWDGDPWQPWLGQAWVKVEGGERRVLLMAPQVTRQDDTVRLAFRQSDGSALLSMELRVLPDGRTIDVSYTPAEGVVINRVRLLSRSLWMTEADRNGVLLLPIRAGLSVPATGERFFVKDLATSAYEGCHMQMLGLLKGGAAALLTWDDVNTTATVERLPAATPAIPGNRILATSVTLWGTSRSFRISCLGRGDAVTVAQAYRVEAKRRGLVQTWDEKIRRNPAAEKLIGATNIKLWSCLSRSIDPATQKEKSHHVSWTFDEAAQVAEHLHRDLKLDRVLFTMGGWIHRGYDNQHPDILPTAPECGGDEAFTAAMKRIAATGFTPCLHDNYQDIYLDSPSYDEKWIMRNARGDLVKGGTWAGGQAYLTCSKMAVQLAQRPQNLPAVRKMTGPIAYFIDTTYAAGLQTCYAPEHPLTWADDLHWKGVLSDYARDTMGLFGSEDGREWAIPHADFFEGITGVSGRALHQEGSMERIDAEPIPLFEMVYHDCIAAYGKYGYAPEHAAEYVLRHLLMGRPINVHNMPEHLYWTKAGGDELPVTPSATVAAAGADSVRISYSWKVDGPVTDGWRIFVHIVDSDGHILAQDDHPPAVPFAEWTPGVIAEPARTVRMPDGANAPMHLQVGFYQQESGRRAQLKGKDAGGHGYRVGTFVRQGDGWRLEPAEAPAKDAGCFVRGDGGWTEGLHSFDRFIKNTHEVLAPLNALTARRLLDGYRRLDEAGHVQESRFGDVRAVANFGSTEVKIGETVLPPFGLLVESPTFVAFHATRYAGVDYPGGALFTLTSLDGQPLEKSKRIRVFHGFGPDRVAVAGKVISVPKEEMVLR